MNTDKQIYTKFTELAKKISPEFADFDYINWEQYLKLKDPISSVEVELGRKKYYKNDQIFIGA